MRKFLLAIVVIVLSGTQVNAWKRTTHLIGVPFVVGSGAYADVKVLQDANKPITRAGAITNLSLMAAQLSLGSILFFGGDSEELRKIHRIVGTSVILSGIFLSVVSTLDDGVDKPARYMAYAHTGLASVPLIIFSF
ncbi:MAG: hypothetical protein GX556_15445 [Fibrobacter sp.]|nr:hypothetical protein [Fibrobacter sp.]